MKLKQFFKIISIMFLCSYCGCAKLEGITPLMTAVYNGDAKKVKELIDRGADVNMKDKYGHSALTRAVRGEYVDIVKVLLQSGADVNIKYDTGWSPLMKASFNQNYEIVKLLIESGANVNDISDDGSTALSLCIREKMNPEVLKLLLKNKADVNQWDGASLPLYLACKKNIIEKFNVVKMLVEYGSNINGEMKGKTALDAAMEYGDEKIINYLKSSSSVE